MVPAKLTRISGWLETGFGSRNAPGGSCYSTLLVSMMCFLVFCSAGSPNGNHFHNEPFQHFDDIWILCYFADLPNQYQQFVIFNVSWNQFVECHSVYGMICKTRWNATGCKGQEHWFDLKNLISIWTVERPCPYVICWCLFVQSLSRLVRNCTIMSHRSGHQRFISTVRF